MNKKQKDPIHIIFIIVHIAGALVTLIPVGFVSKANHLGYKSLCSFTPYSTLVFIALVGLHFYLNTKMSASSEKN
jgi:hypothetical protein